MTSESTGPVIPVRIQRNGEWQAVDFHTLTDDELQAFATLRDPFEGWLWARRVATLLYTGRSE
jgi:hypothetical protein